MVRVHIKALTDRYASQVTNTDPLSGCVNEESLPV